MAITGGVFDGCSCESASYAHGVGEWLAVCQHSGKR